MIKLAILAAFLAAGLLLVRADLLPFWGWCVLAGLTLLMLYPPTFDPYLHELTVSDEGVSHRHGPRLRKKTQSFVRWNRLSRVDVITSDIALFRDDMMFVLHGAEGAVVAVPGSLAAKHGLVPVLQERLTGFSNEQLIAACGSVEPASFTLWEAGRTS